MAKGFTDNVLHKIDSPKDLRSFSLDELVHLPREMRQEIISVVSKNGGHLGGSLGAVELFIALHYVLDTPKDKLVIDCGHQAYPHKLLTGRRESFQTLRKKGGISGFCKPSESEYDVVVAGHTSTSISVATGIATARDYLNEDYRVAALIGDGALTSGLALEGLNNAGGSKTDLLVVLNDNSMSISTNVGALSRYLERIVLRDSYFRLRQKAGKLLHRALRFSDDATDKLFKLEERLRTTSDKGRFFESLGFHYFGPIDGHDLRELVPALRNVINLKGPVLLHVKTEKGKGYSYAEKDVDKLHGVKPFDPANGKTYSAPEGLTFTDAFAETLLRLGEQDNKIYAVTAAMGSGTGVTKFAQKFPDRAKDVGIAEQHAVAFSAGLSDNGIKPVVAIYSTFLQRAYDQIFEEICLPNKKIILAIDRAGLVGDDGPTHHGPYDIAYLRALPNITIMAPKDGIELADMLYTASKHDGSIAIRYPRAGCICYEEKDFAEIDIGAAEILREGSGGVIFALGPVVYDALNIVKELNLDVAVINARFVKPLDVAMITDFAKKTGKVITIEEASLAGGFGSAVAELLVDKQLPARIMRIGIPDAYVDQATRKEQLDWVGLSKERMKKSIPDFLYGAR